MAAGSNDKAPESHVLRDSVDVDTGDLLAAPILHSKTDFVQMVMDCTSKEEDMSFSV